MTFARRHWCARPGADRGSVDERRGETFVAPRVRAMGLLERRGRGESRRDASADAARVRAHRRVGGARRAGRGARAPVRARAQVRPPVAKRATRSERAATRRPRPAKGSALRGIPNRRARARLLRPTGTLTLSQKTRFVFYQTESYPLTSQEDQVGVKEGEDGVLQGGARARRRAVHVPFARDRARARHRTQLVFHRGRD